jgi:glutaredoxin
MTKPAVIPSGAAFQSKEGIPHSTGLEAVAPHPKLLFFTQRGCFSCELMRIFLEANEADFEERDITDNEGARAEMLSHYGSHETPTLVFFFNSPNAAASSEVVTGFNPTRLDQLLHAASSSSSVTEA